MRIFAYIFLYLLIAVPSSSYAEQPLEDLRRGIDKGIQILEDPRYEDVSLKKVQQQKLWEATLQIFDFREFSRRVLASHWKKFTPEQRNDFSRTFAEFLGKFYLRRLQARYNGEKVFYVDQKLISKSRALVEIESDDGVVRVSAARGPVLIEANGESVDVQWAQWPKETDSSISNGAGDVTVRVPRAAGFRLSAESGYGRIDLRMRPDGEVFVIEANANPNLAYGEDFAESADVADIAYEQLLQRILNLGLSYKAPWTG